MATTNLTDRAAGQTIVADFFNSIHTAMEGDFVGRNTSGAPTSGQNLGTAAIPWGTLYTSNISLDGSSLDVSSITSPANRVVSGQTRSTSNQPAFIKPAGSGNGASFDIEGATTNLVFVVNSTSVTATTDITTGSLTAAPGSNNTALVNDTDASDQEATRIWGEYDGGKQSITIDNIGSELTSRDGTWQSFKINDGANDEYFFGYLDTSNNRITSIYRGYYYNESYTPINRITFANNDTITLMNTGYVFLEDNGTTVDVSYTKPAISHTAPSSPSTGDYWFDLSASTWKRYSGSSFVIINRTFLGQVILDDTDCVAARSADFYFSVTPFNNVEAEIESTEIVSGKDIGYKCFSYGQLIQFSVDRPTWNITTDLASSADLYNGSEQSSTEYYLYVSDEGETILSDISPYRRNDLHGYYHPHNPWLCVGAAYNNGSSNLVGVRYNKFSTVERIAYLSYRANGHAGYGSTNTRIPYYSNEPENEGEFLGIIENDSTSGWSFTALTKVEVRAVEFRDGSNASGDISTGFSLNSSQLTTNIDSITASDRVSLSKYEEGAGAARGVVNASISIKLNAGDVLRPHASNVVPAAGPETGISFMATEIK